MARRTALLEVARERQRICRTAVRLGSRELRAIFRTDVSKYRCFETCAEVGAREGDREMAEKAGLNRVTKIPQT